MKSIKQNKEKEINWCCKIELEFVSFQSCSIWVQKEWKQVRLIS